VLILAIGLGGAAGAWTRYQLAGWVYERTGPAFPWGTLVVNLAGSFALGLLIPSLTTLGPTVEALVAVGFLGSFTTFSTFSYEALMLLREGQVARAAAYVGASLGLGLAAIAAGLGLGLAFT
jgi:fluoride exporter